MYGSNKYPQQQHNHHPHMMPPQMKQQSKSEAAEISICQEQLKKMNENVLEQIYAIETVGDGVPTTVLQSQDRKLKLLMAQM